MSQTQSLVPPTVLIVDDQPNNLQVLANIVVQAGWQVRIEVSGKGTITQCEEQPPDLILLDIMLPDLNGFAVCQQLKQNSITQGIPIIFITALTNPADKVKGFEAGAVDYITKPFQYEEVLARLNVHLKISQMEQLLSFQNQQLQWFNTQLQNQVTVRTNQLKSKEETLQNFLDNASDLIQSVSLADGRFLFVNQSWLDTLEYSSQELDSLTIFDVIHPDFLPHYQQLCDQLQRGELNELKNLEICLLSKSGKLIFLEGSSKCHQGQNAAIANWGIFRDMTEHHRTEAKLRQSLQEKETLLKEIHHRVKNNLLIVSSLMDWKCELSEDPAIKNLFDDSKTRINAMALVHEKLYGSPDLARINLGEYLKTLAEKLLVSSLDSSPPSPRIHLDCQLEPILSNLETATPCGLIVNELILNSLKHGFPHQKTGKLFISLKQTNDQDITLTIEDDGIGLPADLDVRKTTSLGWQLIYLLTDQLEGNLTVDRHSGTKVVIAFRELYYPQRI